MDEEEIVNKAASKDDIASGGESDYHITLVPMDQVKLIARPKKSSGAQPPRYDRERDEPAFDAAWKHVAELRAQGKIAQIPPIPQGGLRTPRPKAAE